MSRRVSTAAILKESIEGRGVEEISVSLKIPVSDVVKAVADPKFKRDLLDYRLMRGMQQFEMIGNLKGYLHAYVKALKDVIEHDPEFFKTRIKDPNIEIHKELKGMMDVIRIAQDITDKELRKMLREAEEVEDPALAEARAKLREKRKQGRQVIDLRAEVAQHEGHEPQPTEAHCAISTERSDGVAVGPERAIDRETSDSAAGAAVPDSASLSAGPILHERGDFRSDEGDGETVRSYLLEE